jgi:hypothetical protein
MEESGDSSPPTINVSTEAPESQRRFVEHQESIDNPVLWWLEVPYALLRSWSGADSFIKKLNNAMPDILLPVKSNSPRIEESLRVKVTMVARECKIKQRAGGRTAKKFDEKVFKMSVLSSEVTRLMDLMANNEALVREWRKRYEDLEEEKERLYHEMMEEVRVSKQESEKVQKENVHLHQRVKTYVTEKGLSCRGSKIAEIKTKSGKEKKIKSVRKRAQQALQFLKLFGLTLETLKVTDEKGTNYNLGCSSQSNHNADGNSGYNGLSESDKGKVEEILFLVDKFGVGDEFYHEVTMTKQGEELPRSYLVKQLRSSLNTSCHLSRTPGPAYGAQYSFEDFLVSRVACQVSYIVYICVLSNIFPMT